MLKAVKVGKVIFGPTGAQLNSKSFKMVNIRYRPNKRVKALSVDFKQIVKEIDKLERTKKKK